MELAIRKACANPAATPRTGAMIFARLQAAIGGFRGTFVEAHQLDPATAKKVPKRMIGRALTATEAAALLDRIG